MDDFKSSDIVKSYLDKFPETPTHTLSRTIYNDNKECFNSSEHVRSIIRYYRGANGNRLYNLLRDRKYVREYSKDLLNPFKLPESDEKEFEPFSLRSEDNKILVLSDIHLPYHNIQAVTTAIQYGLDNKVNTILLNGDIIDFHQLSQFVKDPRNRHFKEEKEIAIKFFGVLRETFKDSEIYLKQGNHCFDKETEILTKNGWKNGLNITSNDKLATLNLNTDELEYQYPLEIINKKYDGVMYSAKTDVFDFCVTDGHRMLYTYNTGKKTTYELKSIKDINLSNGRRILMKNSVSNNKKDYNISDNKLKLLAWIMTDGGISKRNGCLPYYTIYQSKENMVNRIETILKEENVIYTKKERLRNTTHILEKKLKTIQPSFEFKILRGRVSGKKIGKEIFLDNLISDKYIFPEFINEISKRQFDLFLDEIVLGDGSVTKDAKLSYCVYGKKSFIEQLQILCVKNGCRASIYKYRNEQYRLNITKQQYSCIDRVGTVIKKGFYNDMVWCATVKNSTLITRRNGKVLVSGNCERLETYLKVKAPELYGEKAFELNELLCFDDFDITYIKDKRTIKAGKLNILHGHELKGGLIPPVNPARGVFLRTGVQTLVGHFHRTSQHTDPNLDNDLISCWSTGCLCEINPEWMPNNKWNHGAAIVYVEESGDFNVDNFMINKSKVFRA